MKSKKNKGRLDSKYLNVDFSNMSDEEFSSIKGKVYKSILVRGISGAFLFIVCIVALFLCGKYLW